MAQPNSLTGFLVRLVILYVILLLPWPGFTEAYVACFCAIGRTAFACDNPQRELTFETPEPRSPRPRDTRVVIVNRALMAPDGSGPVRNLNFDAWRLGWTPTALLIALILASPVPWRRRWRALVLGLVFVNGVIVATLGVAILNESKEVSLLTLTPFWRTVLNGCKMMLTNQISLLAPVLIWILVTFRREDLVRMRNQFARPASTPKSAARRRPRAKVRQIMKLSE